MAVRTVSGGFETYRRASDGEWAHGMFGDVVEVHEDDLERFDRLHPVVLDPDVVDDEVPDEAPSASWNHERIDNWAANQDPVIEFVNPDPSKQLTKAQKLEQIAALKK